MPDESAPGPSEGRSEYRCASREGGACRAEPATNVSSRAVTFQRGRSSACRLFVHPYDVVEHAGRLLIVCGLPGSGKTTEAKRLQAEYDAVRLCPDDWMEELEIDFFDEAARGRIEALQWSLARRLLELRQVVVIERGTWAREERDVLREGARALGAAVELRFLDEPVEVLWERVRRRGLEQRLGSRALTRADLDSYSAKFHRPDGDELRLYDPPLA